MRRAAAIGSGGQRVRLEVPDARRVARPPRTYEARPRLESSRTRKVSDRGRGCLLLCKAGMALRPGYGRRGAPTRDRSATDPRSIPHPTSTRRGDRRSARADDFATPSRARTARAPNRPADPPVLLRGDHQHPRPPLVIEQRESDACSSDRSSSSSRQDFRECWLKRDPAPEAHQASVLSDALLGQARCRWFECRRRGRLRDCPSKRPCHLG